MRYSTDSMISLLNKSYNYIDLVLLEVKKVDIPMKLRRNTKAKRVQTNKCKLGTSIEKRPEAILTREEFGHWEIDTVIGDKFNQVFKSSTSDNGLEFACFINKLGSPYDKESLLFFPGIYLKM